MPPPVVVPPLAPGQAAQPVKFARAAFQIPEGAVWAYQGAILTCGLMARSIRWRAEEWNPETSRLAAVFREELAKAGFAQARNANLFDDAPSADRYQVAALITGMDARFCGNYDATPVPYSGRIRMTVEWQLYDNLRREVVSRFETTAGGQASLSGDGIERTFYDAFRGSVRALLATEGFRTAVTTESASPQQHVLAPISFSAAADEKRTIASSAHAVAAILTGEGHGTGFLISKEGFLLTNHHVVGAAKYVKVRWPDGAETIGEVMRTDRRRDIAVVKADPGSRRALTLRTAAPALGAPVYAIGTPLDAKFQGSVTKGVMSASRVYDGLPFIQSDVVVNGGNSGGPLLDESGAVIGVCVSGMEINGAPVGINLFIPIDDALKALALTPAA